MRSAVFVKIPSIHDDYKFPFMKMGKIVAVVTVTGVGLYFAMKAYKKHVRDRLRKGYKKDTVILHQFDPAITIPSISPFAMKLEMYLRIAKIPYENDFLDPIGPKGKCPWITFNGVDVADSAFCIQFLNEKFRINLDAHLSQTDKAVARCLTITAENNFLLCLAMWRYYFDKDLVALKLMPTFPSFLKLFPFLVRHKMRQYGQMVGIGRHTEQEIYEIGIKDLTAFSDFLGKKQYFFGDKVSEADCALFGILAQCVWALPNSPFEAIVNGKLKNLKDYCIRVKEEFWPHWNEALYKPK